MGYDKDWQPIPAEGFNQCRKCKKAAVEYREWESSCGGYEDMHYRCTACGHDWWIEGADA